MQLSYVSGPSSQPLLGETLGACLDRIAAAHPDAEALVSCHQSLRYTYQELRIEVERIARGSLALGVEPGDRVGIWSANCAEWLILQYAAAKAGAILVNINPAYRLRELEYALRQSGVSILVLARRFRNTDYVDLLTQLAPELRTSSSTPLSLQRLLALRTVVYLGLDGSPGGVSWASLGARGEEVPPSALAARESPLQFDSAVNIQYTSGTTGAPKGATLSHHNFLYTHPAVADVQVIGVPDPKYGEEVCAWVRLHDRHEATIEDIREYCRGQIATYKIPRYVRFTTDFPMTVTGKIQNYRVREISIAELGLEAVR